MLRSRLLLLALVPLLGLALLAACGGDDADDTGEPAAATATVEDAGPSPTVPSELTESGAGPIYWRTLDMFSSLVAGQPYKMVFRITSDFAEPTLVIVAEPEAGGESIEFIANLSEPTGDEDPGSYYPVNIELPDAGAWELAVEAGADSATILVEATAADD